MASEQYLPEVLPPPGVCRCEAFMSEIERHEAFILPRDLSPMLPEHIALRALVDRLFGDKPEATDDE